MLLLASIRDALLALEEGQGETFKQLQAVLFHQGQEVGLLELRAIMFLSQIWVVKL